MNLKKTEASKEIKRKRRLKFSIQQKLLIHFLLVAIIPAVGITIYSTLSLTESYAVDRLNQLGAICTNKADAIESWFAERRGDCKLMTQTPTLMNSAKSAGTWGDPLKANSTIIVEYLLLKMLEIYGTYKEMMLLNTSGHVVAKAEIEDYTFGHSYGEDLSDKVYYTYAYAERDNEEYTFLSDMEWDDMTMEDFVAITVSSPVYNESGTFVGIVVFYIDYGYIKNIMHHTQGLGTSG